MSASEHNFAEGVLVSGDNLGDFSAASDLTQREPVGISGDFEVDSSAAGANDFVGVVLYDVASGEDVSVARRDTEVKVEASEAVDAGDELVPDGSGAFETVATSAASTGVALAQEEIAKDEIGQVEIKSAGGATT